MLGAFAHVMRESTQLRRLDDSDIPWQERPMRARTVQGIVLGTFIGLAVGIGSYTFVYAKGSSYLTNDPACMRELSHNAGAPGRLGQV